MKFKRLRNLKLKRVSLVPRGANQGAHIELFKQQKDSGESSANDSAVASNPDKHAPEVKMADEKTAEELQADLEKLAKERDDAKVESDKIKADLAAEVEKLKGELEAKGKPDVQKQLDETKAELEKIQKAQRAAEFVAKAKDFSDLGSTKEIGSLLEAADTHFDEDQQKTLDTFLKSANEQVSKGLLFKRLSKELDGEADTWEEQLAKAAKERVAKSDGKLTIEQAKVKVMAENPELRKEYQESVRS